MDVRNSALVAAVGLALALAVLLVSFAGFSQFRVDQLKKAEQAARQEARAWRIRQNPPQPKSRVNLSYGERAEAKATIEQLRRLLERKEALLAKKTDALNKVSTEYETLKMEADASIAELLQLVNQSEDAALDSEDTPQTSADPPSTEADSSVATELSELDQQADLLSLQEALAQREMELEMLQTEAEQEVLLLQAERDMMRTLTTETLRRVGAAAVPVLMDMLREERADRRAWAATMLGGMGPAAQEAVPALSLALTDPNVEVRDTARQALALIRD